MTRLGVLRWASRAFGCSLTIEMYLNHEGRCGVELLLPVFARRTSYTYLWTSRRTWGQCVRDIERAILFPTERRPEPGWLFKSQLLVHEEREDLVAEVLGGNMTLAWAVKDTALKPRLKVAVLDKNRRKLRARLSVV